MADRPPANPSYENYADPFADRPRQTQFQEPPRPYHEPPRPFESTASLGTFDQGDQYGDDEYIEKVPLTKGQNFQGAFYPPG